MRAVADAGPIIHLSWINQLDLLGRLFDEVWVPPAVWNEVMAPPDGTLGVEGIRRAFEEGLLLVPDLTQSSERDQGGLEALGPGETDALLLAGDVSGALLLTDDALARAEAQRRGLPVVGTIGLLIQARDEGLIPAALPFLLELRRHGQWIGDALVALVREEEKRRQA